MTEAESRSINLLGAVLPSTVPACLVTSLLTFIGGFVCGRYFARRRYKRSSSSSQPAAPLYEDVNVLPSDVENQERHLEMRENVAYGPTMAARSCTTSRV